MIQNSIAKKAETTGLIEYESGGQMVKLSPKMIRSYLVSGGGNVSDSEVMMFLSLCKFQHLNPFLREAYLIKFGSNPATMVVGKDVFLKRARRNPDYLGKQAGIIVVDAEGNITEREGEFVVSGERIIGGWAKVYIKGYTNPEYAAVSFNEYAGRKSNGELNNQWATKPATMIRKVALVHALREAFPEEYGGMISQEEAPNISDIVLDEAEIVPDDLDKPAEAAAPVPAAVDVQKALFG